MRVLWVKMGGLWPLNTGGRQRSFQLLLALSQRHRVVLVTTDGPSDDPSGLASHLTTCEQVVSIPFQVPKQGSARFAAALARSWASRYPVDLWKWRIAAVRDHVARLLEAGPFDVVVADFLFAVPNVPHGSVPVVFFAHNVEHVIWQRLCQLERRAWRRALLEIEWRKVRRCEARACARAALTVAVSDDDARRLSATAPTARLRTIPTGVDVEYFRPAGGRTLPRHLVFSGSMDWYPNEDAILYFAERILPRIRERLPDATFTVVGRNPSDRLRAIGADRGLTITGTVDDVRPFLDEAALYVVPLRVGGGTRLKIFEAFAMGKAVLSTTVGAEGLGVEAGTHLEIADDPDAFADAAVRLLEDDGRRAAFGHAARQVVVDRYAWPQVAGVFERCLEEARTCDAIDPATARAAVVS